MRPARFAREIPTLEKWEKDERGFNEARAFCAGNSPKWEHLSYLPEEASMRPARFAREIFADGTSATELATVLQ